MHPKSRRTTSSSKATLDTSVDLGKLSLRNPVMTASGTFASGLEFSDYIDIERLGAIVTKGVSLEPWSGNPSPRIAETPAGMLNSIGLQNPGVDAFIAEDLASLADYDVPVIVNISGHHSDEYARVIERLESDGSASGYEVNISCPNVDQGGMVFGTACGPAADVISACRAVTDRLLIAKLSPNVTDIVEIASAVVDAGADAVSLINTLLGMAIDVDTFRPKVARGVGGLSGPAIRPVAVRMVYEVSSAIEVPVIGMGGIMDADDAAEFMLAGASAVCVGTANFVDPAATVRVIDGLEEFCHARGIERLSDITGALKTSSEGA